MICLLGEKKKDLQTSELFFPTGPRVFACKPMVEITFIYIFVAKQQKDALPRPGREGCKSL